MAPHLSIDESTIGAALVLDVAGEIDLATAPQLEAKVTEADPEGHLVLDMTNVTFMDSTGLRVLISAHERANENGGSLAIVAGEGPVTKLLSITGVDGWLSVYPNRAAATSDG